MAKKALGWYVGSMPTYSAVYGVFATVPILLLWVYTGWVIVLLGAVIAAYAPSLQMRITIRPDTPGQRFETALDLLRRLAAARHGATHGMSLPVLADALRADPLRLEPLLDLLVELDWAARLDEGGTPRHVLLCDPALTPATPLVDALLLAPSQGTRAFRERARLGAMTLAELMG